MTSQSPQAGLGGQTLAKWSKSLLVLPGTHTRLPVRRLRQDDIITLSRILKLHSKIARGIEFLIFECIYGYAFSITCLGRL